MAIQKEINIVVKESGMDKVNQSITNLESAVQQTEQSTKSFKAQLREANQELLKMSQKFGETSAEAIQAAKKVADLKDQMELANDLVKSFNPDQKFKALGSATQLAGTGLQGVTAGMALFGDQSKKTEEALLQVQSAMAFSDAISNLSNLGDQWTVLKTAIQNSSVAQKVYTASTGLAVMVQKAFTGSVATTTTGFKLLRGAIISTGIGALVVGVGLLIANFDKVKAVANKVSSAFRDFGENNKFLWYTMNAFSLGIPALIANFGKITKSIMPIINSITDFIGVTSKAERVLDKQKEVAEKALKQNENYLKRNEHKLSEARKRELELNQEHYQRVINGEMTKEESLKILREKANIDKQKAEDEANKIAEEKQKQANEKIKEAERKRIEEANQKAEEERKQRSDLARERGENARKELEDLQQIEADIKKKNEDALKTENELKVEEENARYEDLKQKFINANISTIELEAEHKRNLAKLEDEYWASESEKADERTQKERERDDKITADKLRNAELLKEQQNEFANNVFAIGGALAKKGSKIAKGVAIAQATMNTYQGVTKALAETTDITPSQTLRFANAAAVGVMGAINIAKIASTKEDAGGGASTVGGSPAPPQAPSFNLIQGTGRNQIAENIQNQAPLKAFVVAKDVTTGQSMDRNIIEDARL